MFDIEVKAIAFGAPTAYNRSRIPSPGNKACPITPLELKRPFNEHISIWVETNTN